ncbi:MAG: DUF6777 domain-containing protein [Ilumatobacter sp.]
MSRPSPAPAVMAGGVLIVSLLLLVLSVLWTSHPAQLDTFDGSDGFLMTSEPAAAIGPDPYLSIDDRRAAGGPGGELGITLDPTFGEIGTYGESLADTCDVAVMIAHLTVQDTEAGLRWATAAGIAANSIASHLSGLRADVLVGGGVFAMNGDDDGARTSRTQLLEPGTAVLVDTDGVARVRCIGANPLTPSIDVAAAVAAG